MQEQAPSNARCKASPAQLAYLAEHMKSHPSMASGLSQTLQGRANLESAWESLAAKLNAIGGPIKSVAKWKQGWRDLRNNVKKKAAHNNNEFRGYGPGSTGNGPPTLKELSQVEEQVLSIMGPVAVYGMEDVASTEFIEHNYAESQSAHDTQPPESENEPLFVLPGPMPEEAPAVPVTPVPTPSRKRKRVESRRHDSFDIKLLEIEQQKLAIKRERNAIAQEKNRILEQLVDVLKDVSNKLAK